MKKDSDLIYKPADWLSHKCKARAELDRLQERKRYVYLIAFIGGALIFMLSWLIRGPDDVFIARLYPLFSIAMAVSACLVRNKNLSLRHLEFVLFGIVSVIIFSRLAWHFYAGQGINEQLLMLAGGHYWAIALLVVCGFVVFDHKAGLVSGFLIILVSLIIAGTGLAGQWQEVESLREPVVYLLRIHIFMLLILALTSLATTMREKLKSALVRAEVLDKWANTDMLTELPNRRAAEKYLSKQISRTSRHGRPFWVISADLDNFKEVNDTYGHSLGDEVLAEVARTLESVIREPDLVARWGGEEFIIVAADTSDRGAMALAERCRKAIADKPMAGVEITATLGVAEFRSGDTLEDVLAKADYMLYSGKRAGRNRVVAPEDKQQTSNAPI